MFTDTHCHIYKEYYEDINKLNESASSTGIKKMINNGVDFKSNNEVLEVHKKYQNIYPALGFQPQNLETFIDEQLSQIEINAPKIVAIGEIGLDYYYEPYDKDLQKKVFEKQMQLAEKYNLPVIIHSRKATEDTIEIIKKYPSVRGVIHSFSGSLETANIYIKLGYKLGINGVLTFKNSNLYKVIEKIPVESILLETDSPYLTPEPHRGEKNSPSNIIFIANKICEIKNIRLEELSKITEQNVKEIFDI